MELPKGVVKGCLRTRTPAIARGLPTACWNSLSHLTRLVRRLRGAFQVSIYPRKNTRDTPQNVARGARARGPFASLHALIVRSLQLLQLVFPLHQDRALLFRCQLGRFTQHLWRAKDVGGILHCSVNVHRTYPTPPSWQTVAQAVNEDRLLVKIWRRERILVRIRHLRDGLRQAEVRALAPHCADPSKAWGDVLAKQGKIKDALAKYDAALKYAPTAAQGSARGRGEAQDLIEVPGSRTVANVTH